MKGKVKLLEEMQTTIDLRGLSADERNAALKGLEPAKRSKYGAVKVRADGYTFDSKAEYGYYLVLRDRQERGEIEKLRVHEPKFQLVPKQTYQGRKWRAITYEADFSYVAHADHRRHIVDVKGHETALWKLKWSLLIWKHRHDTSIVFEVVRR